MRMVTLHWSIAIKRVCTVKIAKEEEEVPVRMHSLQLRMTCMSPLNGGEFQL